MYWSARPFVRIVLLYIAGIYSYYSFNILRLIPDYFYYVAVFLFLSGGYFLLNKRIDIKLNFFKGLVYAILIFLFGLLTSSLHYPVSIDNSCSKGYFSGNIITQPTVSGNYLKAVVKIDWKDDTLISKPFKSMVYFKKSQNISLKYGDNVLFFSILKNIEKPKNPEEFDYRKFLLNKGISKTAFVGSDEYEVIGYNPANYIKSIALKLRANLLNALRANNVTGKEFAVAAAIILGYDEIMDDEIRQDYQKAGAMHVLCVSGLHVGIIYLVLNYLLSFLTRTKIQRFLKLFSLLSFIWFYAFLTGLSPSVLRATVMISFFIIGNEVQKDKDTFNTLAMSAFFLLLFNPGLLFNVGFQLSYAAVLGIITFYNPFYNLFWIRNKIFDKLWSVVTVSIAAQLGVFPLATHYFNTFPVYFLLTNLIVFPFSFLIITGGLLFIFVSWIPVISSIAGEALSGMIYLMNILVEWVAGLKGSAIYDLYFPWLKVIIVYIIIVSVFVLLYYKNKRFVLVALSMIVVLLGFELFHKYKILTQRKMLIYDFGYKGNAIDFVNGRKHILLTDIKDFEQIEYLTGKYRVKSGLKKKMDFFKNINLNQDLGLIISGDFILFNGVSIVMPRQEYYKVGDRFKTEKLFITSQTKQNIEKLFLAFEFNEVILSSQLSKKVSDKIKSKLVEKGISYYDISENGCFVMDVDKKQ